MRFFSFNSQKTFTTSLSQEEVISVVQEMLSSKSKVLFFTIRHYFGYTKGPAFGFSTYSGYQTRLLVPVVKGQVNANHPTVVSLKFQHPILPALFLLIFPLMFVPALFTSDEITINGVLREPTMTERISFIILSIGIPAVLYYTNFIRPLQKLHRDIKVKLKLEERASL